MQRPLIPYPYFFNETVQFWTPHGIQRGKIRNIEDNPAAHDRMYTIEPLVTPAWVPGAHNQRQPVSYTRVEHLPDGRFVIEDTRRKPVGNTGRTANTYLPNLKPNNNGGTGGTSGGRRRSRRRSHARA